MEFAAEAKVSVDNLFDFRHEEGGHIVCGLPDIDSTVSVIVGQQGWRTYALFRVVHGIAIVYGGACYFFYIVRPT